MHAGRLNYGVVYASELSTTNIHPWVIIPITPSSRLILVPTPVLPPPFTVIIYSSLQCLNIFASLRDLFLSYFLPAVIVIAITGC